MSKKKEQRLWVALRANAPRTLHLQRVENLVGEGMPDVYVQETGKWVELKAPANAPARASTPLLRGESALRQSQINWMLVTNSSPKAPPVYILIRVDSTRELFLVPGSYAAMINAMSRQGISEVAVARDWESVVKVLSK